MKTNLVKTALLAVAISFALISCENDTLNDLETKKVNIEQIRPIENQNDRELERDLLKELPFREGTNPSQTIPSVPKENQNHPVQKKDDFKSSTEKYDRTPMTDYKSVQIIAIEK